MQGGERKFKSRLFQSWTSVGRKLQVLALQCTRIFGSEEAMLLLLVLLLLRSSSSRR